MNNRAARVLVAGATWDPKIEGGPQEEVVNVAIGYVSGQVGAFDERRFDAAER